MGVDDGLQALQSGRKLDVEVDAAPQEWRRQIALLLVAGDDYDRRVFGLHRRLVSFANLEPPRLLQHSKKIVGKIDVGLVNFVDQHYRRALLQAERLPEGTEVHVVHRLLRIAPPLHWGSWRNFLRFGSGLELT